MRGVEPTLLEGGVRGFHGEVLATFGKRPL